MLISQRIIIALHLVHQVHGISIPHWLPWQSLPIHCILTQNRWVKSCVHCTRNHVCSHFVDVLCEVYMCGSLQWSVSDVTRTAYLKSSSIMKLSLSPRSDILGVVHVNADVCGQCLKMIIFLKFPSLCIAIRALFVHSDLVIISDVLGSGTGYVGTHSVIWLWLWASNYDVVLLSNGHELDHWRCTLFVNKPIFKTVAIHWANG